MHAEVQSVVLVSASPATKDLVRNACANGHGSGIGFAAAPDLAAALVLAADLDNPVLLLESESGRPATETLRGIALPAVLLIRDPSPALEQQLIEAGAADVLPLAELNHGTLRRAVRYALSRHDAERKLARLALIDPVSGLPTQILFWEILALAVRRGQRNRDFFSILLIDFDWTGLSPDITDRAIPVLYKRFAERIKALMRASDTVARFEKSQIVVLAESMPRVEDVQIVAAKILSDITAATAYGDRYVTVNAAIGIAIYPTSGATPEALLARAADALATSLERTTNRFAFG